MKRFLYHGVFSLLAVTMLLAYASENKEEKKPEFIGSKKCKLCHSKPKIGGAEYLKWEKGPHAKAYESLKTEEAKEMAQQAGVADPVTDDKCLVCHITAPVFDTEEKRAEGVGCERCHGPGSLYKSKKVMEDYEAAVAAGMRRLKGENEEETLKNIEKLCRECHGLEHKERNPAAKEFKFDEFSAKIKHDEETLKAEFPEAFE
jgi:hypothetical protein